MDNGSPRSLTEWQRQADLSLERSQERRDRRRPYWVVVADLVISLLILCGVIVLIVLAAGQL